MRYAAAFVPLALLGGCARGSRAQPCADVMTPTASAAALAAEDPTVTDADAYHVLLENDRVRVVEYRDHPGHRTHQHHHPDALLIVLAPFSRRITFPDGTSRERSFAVGDVVWIPAQTHIGENVGTTDSHAPLIEPKR